MMEFFKEQDAFMTDYKKVVKTPLPLAEIAETVKTQLDRTQANHFRLPGSKTIDGKVHAFPFDRTILTDENDGTLSTVYTYTGEPYELEDFRDEEQA